MKVPRPTGVDLEPLSKIEVRAIADELLTGDRNAVEAAVRLVCAETVNLWHGRGPAMMCRRMKHVELSRGQQGRLVTTILGRLASGDAAAWLEMDELRANSGVLDIGMFTGQRMGDTVHALITENLPDLKRNLNLDPEAVLPDNEVRWFRPEDGIVVVDALTALVQKNAAKFDSPGAVLRRLAASPHDAREST